MNMPNSPDVGQMIAEYEQQQAALVLRERNLKAELKAVRQNLYATVGAIQALERLQKQQGQPNGNEQGYPLPG